MTTSYVGACLIFPRKDDGPLFVKTGDVIAARLHGYVIAPIEMFAPERIHEIVDALGQPVPTPEGN